MCGGRALARRGAGAARRCLCDGGSAAPLAAAAGRAARGAAGATGGRALRGCRGAVGARAARDAGGRGGELYVRISRLAELGHELRRLEADYLRDDVYELRVRYGNVNYRILYFFHGRRVAILSHLITKEDKVPAVDIDRAVRNLRRFEVNPEKHTYPGLSKGERS